MHPDQLLEALHQERERLDPNAEDHKERVKEIEAEIKRVDALERPEVKPEEPETAVDTRVSYLDALERELQRAEKDRHAEIEAEIKRVQAELKADQPAPKSKAKADDAAETAKPKPAAEA